MFVTQKRLVITCVVCVGFAGLAAKAKEEGIHSVKSSVENFRDSPNGKRLGTLLENVEIERISQDGKWVRFRIEGWIWGPSLKGFEIEEEADENDEPAPKMPLQDNLPRVKRLINESYGLFYGIGLDADLERLVVRFRVRDLERKALERRQMAVQMGVLEIFEDKVELATVRIETNRPDGSGEVGVDIAETDVAHIRQFAGGEVESWREHSRISSDGGKTWNN